MNKKQIGMQNQVLFFMAILISLPAFSMKTIEIEIDSLAYGNNVVVDSLLSDVIGKLEKYRETEPQHILTMAMIPGEDCEFIQLEYIPETDLSSKVKYEGFLMFKGYMVIVQQKKIISTFGLTRTTASRKIKVEKRGKWDVYVYDPLHWIYILHQNDFYLVYGFPYKSINP